MKDKRIHIQQISIVSLDVWHLPVAWKVEVEGYITKFGEEVGVKFLDCDVEYLHQNSSAIVSAGLDGSVVTLDVSLDNTPFDGKEKNSRMRMYTTIPLPPGFMPESY